MAILISDYRNPAYDGNLSTTSGWWGVEAHNLAGRNGTALSLLATRTIALTFTNAGNLRGFAVALGVNSVPANFRETITFVLKESGVTRQTVSISKSSIIGNTPVGTQNTSFFTPRIEFNYPVTTAVGVWTIEISNSDGPTGNWLLATSNGTAPFYVAWCDNQLTASSTNDTLVISSPINIDASFTTKVNALGTGDAVNGASIVLLTSDDRSAANICNLRCDSPTASYTLTIDGIILDSADSGFRAGTSSSPIPFAQQFVILKTATPSLGTAVGCLSLRYSNTNCGNASYIFHGEVPIEAKLEVALNANTGQPDVIFTAAPTTWQAGDRVWLPKTSSNVLNYIFYTISSISGSTVTMTQNISIQIIATSTNAPSYGVNFERYGIQTDFPIGAQVPNNYVLKGIFLNNVSTGIGRNQAGQGSVGVTDSTTQYLIEDCFIRQTGNAPALGGMEIPGRGCKINRLYAMGQLFTNNSPSFTRGGGAAGGPFQNSGILEVLNCVAMGSPPGTTGNRFGGVGTVFEGNSFYMSGGNATTGQATISLDGFVSGVFKNNMFWRQNNVIALNQVLNPVEWSENKFNGSGAYPYDISGIVVGLIAKNESYGQEVANTNTVRFGAGSFSDFQIENSLGTLTVENTNQPLIVSNNEGSLRVINENQVANIDRIWNRNGFIVRTGTGLADTTKKTGNYSLRFESNNNLEALSWTKNQPTGNIQGKSMTVGIWINVASANYWSGGHTMPRITAIYDNSSIAYGEATQTAGEWQWVQASFIPATTFGQITVILSTQTEATGVNAYVYFADFSGPLPQGSELNLGEFNLWANGFPVSPISFSTLINASDVWSANLNNFGNNTAAKKLLNSSSTVQVGQLLTDALNT